ncbi:RNA-binding RNA annealing protein [Paramarasmius palmivorus]|uniref:RNA-binding RNA annealing protein n=1 Tax=Paramarasmius palmivorus TaxID=297713 RepID=A0AAW0D8I6_9AGAR
MDKSLDDIIKSKPKGIRRASGRSARSQVLGTSPARAAGKAAKTAAKVNAVTKQAATPQQSQPTDKIIVSNLPPDVNEQQVKELFHTTVGPLREVTLHYDSAGRSKGVASVHFQRKGDGTKAYQQYNNRLIDGKRPMKIEIVVDPARPAPASLVSRVAPPAGAAQASGPRQATRGKPKRGGARGGKRKSPRPQKTAADLDAEMEDYTANSGNTAAAAPAAA